MWLLRLFGGFGLEGDRPLKGRAAQRKRQALLGVVAAAPGRSISRDRLLALLWGESDTEQARHLLASAIYDLRLALGHDAIVSVGTDLRLNEEQIECDLWKFVDLLERGERARAVSAYAGTFLDGFHVSDAPEFERWADGLRETLARSYAQAVEALAEEHEAAGDWVGAAEWWRRLAGHDPYSSRVALRLMQVLASAGDPVGAVRHARSHETLLREELGVPPDAQVEALRREILSNPRSAIAAPASVVDEPGDDAVTLPYDEPAAEPRVEPAVDRGTDAIGNRLVRPPTSARPPTWRRHGLAAATILILVSVGAIAALSFRSQETTASPIQSLAVLPLDNLSGDPQQEYLVDGMTDVLTTELARLGQFRVISRTSVMRYKNAGSSLSDIAAELGVDAVIKGSITQQDGRIRVIAQLIRAATDEHLWAQSYERDFVDILSLQGEISREIAAQISSELGTTSPYPTPAARRVDPEAYGAYLKGVYFAGQGDLGASIENYRHALSLDSLNGAAYTGLARSTYFLAFFGAVQTLDAFGSIRTAALQALELDPRNSEAHGLLALVAMHRDWDFAAAEQHFHEALTYNPNNAQVRHDYSHFLLAMHRTDEAVGESSRAVELDPFSPSLIACLGWHNLSNQRYEQATEHSLHAMGMAPEFFWPHLTLGWVYEQTGRWEEAIATLRQAAALSGEMPFAVAALGHALAASGRREEAGEIAADLERRSAQTYVSAYEIAAIYAGLNDSDQAARWLQRAYAERSTWLINLNWEPRLANVRDDPSIRELSRRIGLPN